MKERDMIVNGLYIVQDRYFATFPSDRTMKNKSEARPNYYAIKDRDGIFWMIPLSKQVEKYRNWITRDEKKYGPGKCVLWDISVIAGIERAVLIGNMFPVLPEYIQRAYTIDGIPYIVKNTKTIDRIRKKAMRYLNLVENHRITPVFDILAVKNKLLNP